MATLLVQSEQDSVFLNSFNTIVPLNVFNKNKSLFNVNNYLTFKIDQSYNYRPDKVAFKVYGDDYYYPLILMCNNIGSILQFHISKIGNKVFYLNPELISYLNI